jgi:hypothetical protein
MPAEAKVPTWRKCPEMAGPVRLLTRHFSQSAALLSCSDGHTG